jgi:hypothetical protein
VGKEAGLTVLLNRLPAPIAKISYPPHAALLPPGTVVVTGTASANATRVQVRLRGAGVAWVDAPVVQGTWQATLALPAQDRAWRIEARAVDDATKRYQAPPAQRRIRVETFAYVVADNSSTSSSQDRLLIVGLSTARATLVGDTGTEHVEALAFKPGTATLYAADAGQLGILDLGGGLFTPTAARFGKGRGAKGKITLNDVDGLAFDPASGILYGAHRRSDKGDKDLLFQINPITGTRTLDAFGAGKDYVVVDGNGVPNNIDDLAFDPATGTLYGAANNGGDSGGVLVTIDPANGNATVVGPFGVDDMEGLGFTSDGRLYGTTGSNGGATKNKLYTINKITGKATPVGPIAGQRDYESIAAPPAGVVLPLPTVNAALPRIDSATIDGGAITTTDPAVTFQASTSGPTGSARWMRFVEYHYNPATKAWAQATSTAQQASGWVAATDTGRYELQLNSTAGVKYLQAWAADSAGQPSRLPYQSFINYIPASDKLARNETRIYRYTVRVGERLTARAESSSGDADVFIWSSNPDVPPWASNLSSAADQVSLVAPADGSYQIEVRGHSAASYRLTVTVASGSSAPPAAGGIAPGKPVPSQPTVPVDSAPSIRQATPLGPATEQRIYVPVVRR